MEGRSCKIDSPNAVIGEGEFREGKVKLKSVLLWLEIIGLTKRFVVGITWPQDRVVMRLLSR